MTNKEQIPGEMALTKRTQGITTLTTEQTLMLFDDLESYTYRALERGVIRQQQVADRLVRFAVFGHETESWEAAFFADNSPSAVSEVTLSPSVVLTFLEPQMPTY